MESIEIYLGEALRTGSLLVYITVFLGGVAASFTPCTYPVLPLTVGYIGSASGTKKWRAFAMSVSMVIGMALVYAILGVIFAILRKPLGSLQGNGIFLTAIAVFFIIMSLFLLDVFTFQTPKFLNRLSQGNEKRKGLGGAFIVGGISGLLVGSCTGPILAVVIGFVTATLQDAQGIAYIGEVFSGGLKLFIFGLGQGTLIILCGTFSGFLNSLPKAGTWMVSLKKGFACMIMAGGCLLLLYAGNTTGFDPLSRVLLWAEGAQHTATPEPVATEDSTPEPEHGKLGPGAEAPEVELYDNSGNLLTLSSLRGKKGAVLVFFATWCPSCMQEVPEVIKLKNAVKDRAVEVYGVNFEQTLPVIKRFIEKKGVNYPILLDINGVAARNFGVVGIPHIVAVDSEGMIRFVGSQLPHDFSRLISILEPKK